MSRKPDTKRVTYSQEEAESVLLRLRPLMRQCAWEPNVLDSLMLGCYIQGAMDARTPAYEMAMREAEAEAAEGKR